MGDAYKEYTGDKIFNKEEWGDSYTAEDDQELLGCVVAAQDMSTNFLRYPYWQMFESSAQDLFDIGQSLGCERIGDDGKAAVFAILNFYMTTVSSQIKMGVCIPA